MRVRLTRRFANFIDGVNLLAHNVGDVFEVTRHEGELLVAEEWAVPVVPLRPPVKSRTAIRRSRAKTPAIGSRCAGIVERLHQIQDEMNQPLGEQKRRRAEDRIREELHDSLAVTIPNRLGTEADFDRVAVAAWKVGRAAEICDRMAARGRATRKRA